MTEDELFSVDYDLSAGLRYNGLGQNIGRIAKVHLSLTDGTDYPSFHWIVELVDGKFAYVSGGHDYTGWDCQSDCEWLDADTFDAAMQLVPQDERRVFEAMILGGAKHLSGYEKGAE